MKQLLCSLVAHILNSKPVREKAFCMAYTHTHRLQFRFSFLLKAIVPLCALLFCSFSEQQSTEYKLKAAFLYNFIQYIEWENPPAGEFVIGIAGSSPIAQPLENIAHLKSTSERKIIVRHINSADEISGCQIVFIPQNSSIALGTILSKASKGTLTVSEREGFAAKGTAINFVIVDNKVKFESNLKAINSAGLKASSQLLKLAIIVGGN
jgi:hypothetical protein